MGSQCVMKIELKESRNSQADRDKTIAGKTTTKNCWEACLEVFQASLHAHEILCDNLLPLTVLWRSLYCTVLYSSSHRLCRLLTFAKFAYVISSSLPYSFIFTTCLLPMITLFLSALLSLLPLAAACTLKQCVYSVHRNSFGILAASCWRSRPLS